jgi:hypothetical protein
VRNSVAEVVLLGAGFDTRAYRIPGIAGARIFEVDHLATQAVKIQRALEALFIISWTDAPPDSEPAVRGAGETHRLKYENASGTANIGTGGAHGISCVAILLMVVRNASTSAAS